MKTAILSFPGINRETDMALALQSVTGQAPVIVWHLETELPKVDLVAIPGGFSYGDYLRCGAIAARSHIMRAVRESAQKGLKILGVCNGFQILTEAGLLPGALMRNVGLRFVCRTVTVNVESNATFFTRTVKPGSRLRCPVAHADGNYRCDPETLKELENEGRVVFRYVDNTNPNGALNDIAGISNAAGTIVGLMPHPENMIEPLHGSVDCRPLFEGLLAA